MRSGIRHSRRGGRSNVHATTSGSVQQQGPSTSVVSDNNFLTYKQEGEALGLTGRDLVQYVENARAAEREREAAERAANRETAEREREAAEREANREAAERAAERDREAAERESQAERDYQLELKRIESQANAAGSGASGSVSHTQQIISAKVKLPYLDDGDDLESYLAQFEKVAAINGWKVEDWGTRIAPLLKGRARDAYVKLPTVHAADYEAIKNALLHKY